MTSAHSVTRCFACELSADKERIVRSLNGIHHHPLVVAARLLLTLIIVSMVTASDVGVAGSESPSPGLAPPPSMTLSSRMKPVNEESAEEPSCTSDQFDGPTEDLFLHVPSHIEYTDISVLAHSVTMESEESESWVSRNDLTTRSIDVDLGDKTLAPPYTVSFRLIPSSLDQEESMLSNEGFTVGDSDGVVTAELETIDGETIALINEVAPLDPRSCNHIALIVGVDSVTLAVNGVPVSQSLDSSRVRSISDGLQAGLYPGRVWDFRLYSAALSDGQIESLAWKCAGVFPDDVTPPDGDFDFLCGVYNCKSLADGFDVTRDSHEYYVHAHDMVVERHVFEARMYPRGKLCDYIAGRIGVGGPMNEDIIGKFVRGYSFENPLSRNNGWYWMHENFHAHQSAVATGQGFGSNKWFLEASASWAADYVFPGIAERLAGYYSLDPHFPIWMGQGMPMGESIGAEFKGARPYGMFVWLSYVTRHVLDVSFVGDIYTTPGGDQAAKMYALLEAAGHDMREVFIEFAARTVTWDYEYGSYYANNEIASLKDRIRAFPDSEGHDNRLTARYADGGTGERWVDIPSKFRPGAWGYNAYKVMVAKDHVYSMAIQPSGSNPEGAEFRAKVVVHDLETGARTYHDFPAIMGSETAEISVPASAGNRLYLVVATTPPTILNGFDTFEYAHRIVPDTPPVELEPAKVFLLAGEQDMTGAKNPAGLESIDATLRGLRDDVFIESLQNPARILGALGSGYSATDRQYGIELKMGHVLGDALYEDVYLYKVTAGGLLDRSDQWRPRGHGGDPGNTYDLMIDAFTAFTKRELEDKGIDFELAGFVWTHGDKETADEVGPGYEGHLRNLVSAVRRDLGAPELPIVITQINDTRGKRGDIVMAGQAKVAEEGPNTSLAVTSDLRPYFRYGANSHVVMGDRIAQALLPHLGRPAAAPDDYSVTPGASLGISVGAGVLANDVGDGLISSLVSSTKLGTIELEPDGTFTYSPRDGELGQDDFTYRVTAGDGAVGNVSTARIWVRDAADPLAVHYRFDEAEGDVIVDAGSGVRGEPRRRHLVRTSRPDRGRGQAGRGRLYRLWGELAARRLPLIRCITGLQRLDLDADR